MEPHDWQLLERFKAGECTLDEAEHARTFLATHADGRLLSAVLRALDPRVSAGAVGIPAPAAAYEHLRERIVRKPERLPRIASASRPWFAMATGVCATMALLLATWIF